MLFYVQEAIKMSLKMLPYNDVNLNTEKIGREKIYKNIRLIKLLAKQ